MQADDKARNNSPLRYHEDSSFTREGPTALPVRMEKVSRTAANVSITGFISVLAGAF